MKWRFLFLTILFFQPLLASESISKYNINDFHPTQLYVGMAEVNTRVKKLTAMTPRKQEAYLLSHPALVIVGPQNNYYLIDRHHLSRALLQLGHKQMHINIVENWSAKNKSAFWKDMEVKGYVYLYDQSGAKITPADLPVKIVDLKDNPYRSLAYFVRERGGFNKTKTPFAEFLWAAYFRKHIKASEVENWDDSIEKALKLAQNPSASTLPGYKGP